MENSKLFHSVSGTFSKKEYLRKKKTEEKKLNQIQKALKAKFKEQEKKRKILSKSTRKRKIRPKIQIKKRIHKKPTLQDLENYLTKLSDSYDKNTTRIRNQYEELKSLGLTTKGIEEKKYESKYQTKTRISKINKIHKDLMKDLENNKELEIKIQKLHDLISNEKFLK